MSTVRPRNAVSVDRLNAARRAHRRVRAEWLVQINYGLITPLELIEFATTDDGAPLRSVRLRDLLMSQQGWGQSRAETVVAEMRFTLWLDPSVPERRLTVGWLLDNRTSDRRLDAFASAMDRQRTAPHPEFPFATRRTA